jgi:hypothetical protein
MLAIACGIALWRKKGNDTIEKPKETVGGDFVITKPSDEYMNNLEFDEISLNPKLKDEDKTVERLPDPKGTPTERP